MPWELMRSADNVRKPQDNTQKAQNLECRVPEKIESPNKRIRQETRRESEAEEIEEAKKVESSNAFDGQPSVENWKNECILSIEEWLHSRHTGNECAQHHDCAHTMQSAQCTSYAGLYRLQWRKKPKCTSSRNDS